MGGCGSKSVDQTAQQRSRQRAQQSAQWPLQANKQSPQPPGRGVTLLEGPSIPEAAVKYLVQKPLVQAPLDPTFSPFILGKRRYLSYAKNCTDRLEWALVRFQGCARGSLPVFPAQHPDLEASIYLAGVLIQEMIWQRSAFELQLCGPQEVCEALEVAYSPQGAYAFEVATMPGVCGLADEPFKVLILPDVSCLAKDVNTREVCGREANGCRLAFDLRQSDITTAAVRDGEVVYSKRTPWDIANPDPEYHYKKMLEELMEARMTLPRVDAIGGSAPGTISACNETTWCDLFHNVPADIYKEKVRNMFGFLSEELAGNVPLKVINDGEVAALRAVRKISAGNVLGICMGTTEGTGYANADGNLTGWINELCYVRLDMSPAAPTDPWTKGAHMGISHMYLGQRGATKLAERAGIELPPELKYTHPNMFTLAHEPHTQCLKLIQKAMADPVKKTNAHKIFETLGVYLGYALAQYSEFYRLDHVMIFGEVSKGAGGSVMLATARKVLEVEFPELARIQLHIAYEFNVAGQCIAAAALPFWTDTKVPESRKPDTFREMKQDSHRSIQTQDSHRGFRRQNSINSQRSTRSQLTHKGSTWQVV